MKRKFFVALWAVGFAPWAFANAQLLECGKDIRRFCVQVPNERLWIEKCLEKNKTALSSECVAASGEKIAWLAEFANSCIRDREKFCARVPSSPQLLRQCLIRFSAQLSPECGSWILHD